MRVDVRNESKVSPVTRLQENRHQRDQAYHRVEIFGVKLANDDQEGTRHHADEVDPELLRPQVVAGPLEDQVAEKATSWAGDDVEKAEHGRPATGGGLPKVSEVFEVVRAKDGVDREFTSE